jgi:hypothetical protein
MRRFFALLSSLLLIATALWSADCQCPKVSPQDLLETATIIFRGTVDEIQTPKKGPVRYLFVINDTFKGDTDNEIILQDAEAGQDCASTFEKNKEYLVYARWQWGLRQTSRCWGTKPIDQANADQSLLGPGDEWKSKLYPKLHDACMGTYETPCCLAGVKAMEKGHFLPEPENGCSDGMRPNVVNCKGSLRWCEPIVGSGPPIVYQP